MLDERFNYKFVAEFGVMIGKKSSIYENDKVYVKYITQIKHFYYATNEETNDVNHYQKWEWNFIKIGV